MAGCNIRIELIGCRLRVGRGRGEDDLPLGVVEAERTHIAEAEPLSADRLGVRFSPSIGQTSAADRVRHAIEQFCHLLVSVQESAGLTAHARPLITNMSAAERGKGPWTVRLMCPSPHPALLARAAPEIARILNLWLVGKSFEPLAAAIAKVIAGLAKFAPGGKNMRLLLDAAHRLEVPTRPVSGRTVQLGWGSRARWIDSTVTDATPAIATRIARDKREANRFLAARGVPVPRQMDAPTIEAALAAAATLGFPVAVKPANLDGGVGVTAGIEDQAGLKRAYEVAQRHSPQIVVESHIAGQDFRLGVVHGEVAWATSREPAGVSGDGVSTLRQLIDRANQDTRRGVRSWSLMTPLSINEEAEALLAAQGLRLDDVPEQERFVRLRSAANISAGGYARNILAQVHPDNRALAARAARLMRLDIAGIDLIVPDIGRSWRETGGAICEVNAQPQFTADALHAPFRIVGGLFEGDGRIPAIVILGDESVLSSELLVEAFRARGLKLGLALAAETSVDGHPIPLSTSGSFNAVETLLVDPDVDVVVALVPDERWLASGSPLEKIDLLLAGKRADPRMKTMLSRLHAVGTRALGEGELTSREGAEALAGEAAELLAWHDGRALPVDRITSAALSASPHCRAAPPRPGSIGLCMIAKDEAPIIRESLDSVRGLVDFVLVEDTGSTDGTQKVVRQWLEENGVAGAVTEVPWRDFAWNRSHALAELRARHDVDYALILDADDLLVLDEGFNAERFKAGLTADVYDLTIHYGALRFPRPQLLRNARAFGYLGVLHEFVDVPADSVGRELATGLHVQAYSRGARSRNPRKYADDAATLEKALERERDPKLRSRYLFYLAQSYQDGHQHAKALDAYLRRAATDFWPEEMFVAAYRAAGLQERLGYPPSQVEATYRRAIAIAPERMEAYHGLSRFLRLRKQYEQGYEVGRTWLERGDAKRQGLFIEARIYQYGLLVEAALNASLAGRSRECAALCDKVLAVEGLPGQLGERIRRIRDAARPSIAPLPQDMSGPLGAMVASSVSAREIRVGQ